MTSKNIILLLILHLIVLIACKLYLYIKLSSSIVCVYFELSKYQDSKIKWTVCDHIVFFSNQVCGSNTSKKIPDHLLNCYSRGGVNVTSPLNVQLLIELFSKIEQKNSNYNMRTISSSLLHRFDSYICKMMNFNIGQLLIWFLRSLKLDGIKKAPQIKETDLVTPFRASSFQYAKHSFLLDLLIPGEKKIDLLDDLSDTDICTLHFLLSSTVDEWERGDEAYICPMSMTKGEMSKSVFVKDNS